MDVANIAKLYNEVIGETDKSRLNFSKIILTIYTAVSSGLVFLAISVKFNNNYEKLAFFAMLITSVLAVFSAILESFGYFLIKNNIAGDFTKYVREHESIPNNPLGGKKWHTNLVKTQIYFMLGFVALNLTTSLIFAFLIIF